MTDNDPPGLPQSRALTAVSTLLLVMAGWLFGLVVEVIRTGTAQQALLIERVARMEARADEHLRFHRRLYYGDENEDKEE